MKCVLKHTARKKNLVRAAVRGTIKPLRHRLKHAKRLNVVDRNKGFCQKPEGNLGFSGSLCIFSLSSSPQDIPPSQPKSRN